MNKGSYIIQYCTNVKTLQLLKKKQFLSSFLHGGAGKMAICNNGLYNSKGQEIYAHHPLQLYRGHSFL